jgi:N-acetylmuramoyl-L-alanine amidase
MRIPWQRRSDTAPDASGAPTANENTPAEPVADQQTGAPSGLEATPVAAVPVPDVTPKSSRLAGWWQAIRAKLPWVPQGTGEPGEPRVTRRRGLIPEWLPWAGGAAAGLIVIVVVAVLLLTRTASVRVPSLDGLDRASALKRTKELGLVLAVRDTRFSAAVPAGAVIDQVPGPGAVVPEGTTVRVDLSAGSETFAMPDVVGQGLDAARRALRDRGLDVQFQTAPSDAAQGTVISSAPSAGETVTTGATVRLTVAAGVSSTDTLLPSDLSGVGIVLDPAPAPTGASTDVAFDVARRVRALLEASGARVIVTRAVTDTTASASTTVRLAHAKESTSTALVGLYVATSGTAGLQVQSVVGTGTAASTLASSTTLAQALITGLRADFSTVGTATAVGDTVLEGIGEPAARVRLGSNDSSSDKIAFADPQWADNVARDIYRALARTYGRRQ